MMSIAASVEYIKIIAVLKVHICGYWVVFWNWYVEAKTISSAILCKSEVRILANSCLNVWSLQMYSLCRFTCSYTIKKQIFKSTKETQFKTLNTNQVFMHKKKPNSNLNKNSDLKHKREKSNFKPQIKRSDLKYNLKEIQFQTWMKLQILKHNKRKSDFKNE